MTVKTADLCDDYAKDLSVCQLTFQSYGKRQAFSGKITTVEVFEDNVLVKERLKTAPRGSVVVVNGGGSRRCALLGDRLGDIAVERGLAGIIINGCVRDSSELKELEVGIFALGTMPLKSEKRGEGNIDVPVKFGGVTWNPGEYVYADEDGIVISEVPLMKEEESEQTMEA
ncbi:ribonuclease E activity regulator RraA [Bacillus tianshenii]|nr:ribonuclease E activity regulator RraA [Bacillus tianshenii]